MAGCEPTRKISRTNRDQPRIWVVSARIVHGHVRLAFGQDRPMDTDRVRDLTRQLTDRNRGRNAVMDISRPRPGHGRGLAAAMPAELAC